MQLRNIKSISVAENRQRKQFNEKRIEELAQSIRTKGLMHPVVVRDTDDEGHCELVAGERRLRALQLCWKNKWTVLCDGDDCPPQQVPCILQHDLPEDLRVEAELEENVIRVDLTVQERAAAYKRLHDLRVKQKGPYDASLSQFLGEPVGQRVEDTAKEILGDDVSKSDVNKIRAALLIAQHLDDPEVAAASTEAEALKAIKETQKVKIRNAKAAEYELNKQPHTLHHGDCYSTEYAQKFDCVIADPPYGIDIGDNDTRHKYDDSDAAFAEVCEKLPALLWQVTKDKAHVWVFCDYSRYNELWAAFELAGFTCWPRPLIWDKGNVGSFGNMELGFRKTYECIIFANKGGKLKVQPGNEVYRFNPPQEKDHPAAKPVDLYVAMLRQSCNPGDFVLDPYCGRGTIFTAATTARVIATGVEKDTNYYNLSKETIAKEVGDLSLDDLVKGN